MEPFERFKKTIKEGNLWIYLLSLGKEGIVVEEELRKMIFEKFEFLPNPLLLKRVLFQLKRGGLIKKEKFKGKTSFQTTEKGKKELKKLMFFLQEFLTKI